MLSIKHTVSPFFQNLGYKVKKHYYATFGNAFTIKSLLNHFEFESAFLLFSITLLSNALPFFDSLQPCLLKILAETLMLVSGVSVNFTSFTLMLV